MFFKNLSIFILANYEEKNKIKYQKIIHPAGIFKRIKIFF